MAYSSSGTLGDRLDSGRFRSPDIPSTSSFSFFDQPNTTAVSQNTPQTSSLQEARASLHRRFTTNNLPTTNAPSPIGQPRRQQQQQQPETSSPDSTYSINHKVQLLEKKKAEYDYLRQKRLQFQNEMDLIDLQAKREEDELRRLQQDLSFNNGAGHQSEPTTPPEYRDNGFPTALSRPNRFSASNVNYPPGLTNRLSRTDSQLSSPPSERARAYQALTSGGATSSGIKSGNEEEDDNYADTILDFNHRSAATLNRNSMPVTRRDRTGVMGATSSLGHVNTSAFLFGDEYEKSSGTMSPPSGQGSGGFLQMNTNEDQFPILVRREGEGQLGGPSSSDAFDSAQTDTPESHAPSNGWPSFSRPLSLQTQGHSALRLDGSGSASDSPTYGLPEPQSSKPAANRHSMGAKVGAFAFEPKRPSLLNSPSNNNVPLSNTTHPKLQSSYSTSDIPTISSISGGLPSNNPIGKSTGLLGKVYAGPGDSAEQRLHNHNASLGRIPPSAYGNGRHSRELSNVDIRQDYQPNNLASQTGLAQSAASQYPPGTAVSDNYTPVASNAGIAPSPYTNPAMYGGYNAQNNVAMLSAAMNNMQIGGQAHWNGQGQAQTYQQPYSNYQSYPQPYNQVRQVDMHSRNMQQRRGPEGKYRSDNLRFSNIALDNLRGEIYGLCKDQHGCRYLQKKLEERKPSDIQLIFNETKDHMVELMTDPFGNYLCQKLLEYTNDAQRTSLIDNAAPDMVKIALNQHGTRALQKMIDFVSTEEQIQTVIYALKDQVVPMIQDLNGNHVVQKCLNKLSPQDAQFIFDAVAMNCVTVGTHRHGCCVIQRCIDHASGQQRAQLVSAVIDAAFPLVQDPFGNYVLQYIFDQGEEQFSQPLCRAFLGNIAMLSRQKFSSNVIEKCIRIADVETRHLMIEEIVYSPDFERLADDAFANYVVQTAWDYAEPADEAILAEKIRPVLPRMRHKPYGRRFQNRIQERDKRMGLNYSANMSPLDGMHPEAMLSLLASQNLPTNHNTVSNFNGMANPAYSTHNSGALPTYGSNGQAYRPGTQGLVTGPYPNQAPTQQNNVAPYNRHAHQGVPYY